MTAAFAITFLTFLVAGTLPPVFAAYVVRVRFLGGVWAAIAVGVLAAFLGGLIDTLWLDRIGDLIPIAGEVDAAPPLGMSLLLTTLYAIISATNRRTRS
jgi:hypothetical protein